MHIVKFVFRFVESINPMAFDDNEGQMMYNKMLDKYKSVNITPETDGYKESIWTKVVVFFNNPFVQFVSAALFPFLVKGAKDYLNGRFDEPTQQNETE